MIIGPAVVALLGGSSLLGCSFDGDLTALLWDVPPERGTIIGAIGLDDCILEDCRLQRIGFAATPELREMFKRDLSAT